MSMELVFLKSRYAPSHNEHSPITKINNLLYYLGIEGAQN